ncbi:Lipoprotein [Rhodococcus sp. RD6.2]|uniref:SIMPL domain-containing protein n=1 Tax=Rhodococcus sp. RD6.2 TaxID=260936 RepID=UPI00063B444B|nr:SIMPL domain-containing protein [Rhodococcus sp. RD6.2]CRK50689.1 Lipoprotein [Rhodococcus sp. RD6.2]
MKILRPLTVATTTAAVGLVLVAGCSSGSTSGDSGSAPPGISTQAVGTVTAAPDTATVVLGVQTQAATADAALAANAERATALIDSLKAKGVAEGDIATSGLSVQPTFGNSSTDITGYQVTNQVTATVHDIAGAGELIDAAAAAAGDAVRVQSLSFSVDDDSELRAQARSKAVQQAQTQAGQIADAAGVSLGGVRSITEVSAETPAPMQGRILSDQMAATPVQPGTQDLTVTVSVVYDID